MGRSVCNEWVVVSAQRGGQARRRGIRVSLIMSLTDPSSFLYEWMDVCCDCVFASLLTRFMHSIYLLYLIKLLRHTTKSSRSSPWERCLTTMARHIGIDVFPF